VPYTTEMGEPSGDCSVMGAGHVILGGSGTGGGGGVGCDGELLHAWNATALASAISTRRRKRVGRDKLGALAAPERWQHDWREREREGAAVASRQRYQHDVGAFPA